MLKHPVSAEAVQIMNQGSGSEAQYRVVAPAQWFGTFLARLSVGEWVPRTQLASASGRAKCGGTINPLKLTRFGWVYTETVALTAPTL